MAGRPPGYRRTGDGGTDDATGAAGWLPAAGGAWRALARPGDLGRARAGLGGRRAALAGQRLGGEARRQALGKAGRQVRRGLGAQDVADAVVERPGLLAV